jgi:hypothetical protein
MNKRELERALIGGVRLSIDRAFKWSGNDLWPGDTGAENLLQVSIADCISRGSVTKPLIHLEPTLNSIAPSIFGGDSRRVDIGLKRRSRDEFYSLIEVKKYPGDFSGDLDKICSALAHVKTISYGYLVTYFQKFDSDAHAKKSLEQLIADTSRRIAIETKAKHKRACASLDPTFLRSIEDWGGRWRAAALITRFDRD